jgi:MerR family redox-sensitive transcriptional activator SoxR
LKSSAEIEKVFVEEHCQMGEMSISEVARKAGLRASTIRYYEQIQVMRPAPRAGGKRRYDSTVLYRLAVIERARQLGFTLNEIRQLFFSFRPAMKASARWRSLSRQKLAELEELAETLRTMQKLLRRLITNCHCESLEQCGKAIFGRGRAAPRTVLALNINPHL